MAKNCNLILAGAFLLVFLFAYGITFTEARLLKADHNLDESGNVVHVTNVMSSGRKTNLNRHILDDASSAGNVNTTAYDTDDFRPTTPGHSPGAGHSTGPASDKN
ncbi:hypothetical protein REPUB_Repub19eG0040400 [Reevesia pubescens]